MLKNIKKIPVFIIVFFLFSPVNINDKSYVWDDYRIAVSESIRVCHNKNREILVDLPASFLQTQGGHVSLVTEVTSDAKRVGESTNNFKWHEAWFRLNDHFFGSYLLPTENEPATQTVEIKIKRQYLKAGRNKIQATFSWKNSGWSCAGDCCGYYIKKLYFKDAPSAKFMLSVRTNPKNARIFLDGEKIGISPVQTEIDAGFYELSIEKDGYKKIIKTVQFPGDKTSLTENLEQIKTADIIPQSNFQKNLQTFDKKEKRLSLVIGNGDYMHGGSLANPKNDANAIASSLKKLGFHILLQKNADQKTMKRSIDEFGRKLKEYDTGLFFYAGHGVQVDGYNFLIPIDAKLDYEADVEYDCVRVGRVLSKMESAASKTNIIILDACRDNPFERGWARGSKGKGLAFMNAPTGSLIAYATSPGATASDGTTKNGLFTHALLMHIETPNIPALQMFQRVRKTVIDLSDGKQIPWESTSLISNFYFQ